MSTLMDKQNQQNEGTYDEVDRYIALKLGEDEQYSNPLDFWKKKDNQLAFPSLFQLAKRYFAIPCSSSAVERQFSAAENGLLAQFNNDKKLWQLLFAPERTGPHELIVYAKRTKDGESSKSDSKFNLDVTKLRRPMKFHMIYTQFRTKKCQIYTPMDGILKKGSVVPIHCVISGAKDVNLTIDSNWIKNEGYRDPVL
ncbi:unnamed protein product [Rotaria socialis]|uniref:HAT C-terminal dimerisation domain-containing protein n=1 Tax=Rotaria socialis TaxID=392032 RepID=A0A819YQP1_9BILA|nr:unnamed protein product [Rotaria socialis]